MKWTAVLMTFAFLHTYAASSAQNVTILAKGTGLKHVFTDIEKQTGYVFFANDLFFKETKPVTIEARNKPVFEVLNKILEDQPLEYVIQGKTIILSWKRRAAQLPGQQQQVVDTFIIRGKVQDALGKPVSAASVVVPGTPFGTHTEGDGSYELRNAPRNAEIVFSYIGYETVRVRINGRTRIDAVLVESVSGLLETVVIGYGTTTKTRNTGSISSIGAEEIAKQPVANPLNALQGRVAGALVTQSNGLPGSRVTIVVRGLNTLDPTGAGAQPLYIVDGVPFNIQDGAQPVNNDLNARGAFAANGGISPFSIINPAEIERIDVLKDADATAIYGTRGANGVVLITTKKGKSGKTRVDVNVYRGAGKVGHFIPMMNNAQYRQMRYEAFSNDGIIPTAANAPDLLVWDSTLTNDWQRKYLGGTASTTDAQATISGGDQRTRFLLNAGYHKETTVFPGDFDDYRISSRMNVDHNSLDRKFNASISVNYSYGLSNLLNRDFSTLFNLPPNLPLYDASGKLFWVGNFRNPEANFYERYIGKTNNLMTNAVLRYTLMPGLDIKTSFGFNTVSLDQNSQTPVLSKSPLSGVPTNSASFANINQRSYILEPQITYNTKIGKGRLSALLGSTFQHSLNTSLSISADNYSTAALLGSLAGAGSYGNPVPGYTLYRYNSLFGRLTYDWDSRYVVNVVARRDGSSRFGPDNRFGDFWSLGAGWVFSNENFIRESQTWLSFGKLRASYGVTGNDQIGDYLYRTLYTARTSYQNGAAIAPNRIDNPALKWQTTYKMEFGMELGFLQNRFELTANYYRNRTPNQLGFLSMSNQAGFNSYGANFDALIQNTGFELELNTTNVRKKDFKWSTAFNLTIPRTKVVSASKSYFFYNQNAIGQQLSYALRYQYRGVDPSTGNPMYTNKTKDTLTFTPNFNADRAVAGFTAPKAYGGINNNISYRNFDISFFFQYTIQSGNVLPTSGPGPLANGNMPVYWLDRWQKPGDPTNVPRYSSNTTIYSAYGSSDAVFGNTSFLRLRNANIAYRLPSEWAKRIKTDNLRVYLQGQNLWWTSRQKYVYDPETGTAMPPLRVITAGINVSL